jgi:hypothetical protein
MGEITVKIKWDGKGDITKQDILSMLLNRHKSKNFPNYIILVEQVTWITDRKPDYEKDCLIQLPVTEIILIAKYDKKNKYFKDKQGNIYHGIIAWHPLPQVVS